jgi:hypothetical protein
MVTLTLLAALVVVILASVAIWRANTRVLSVGAALKDISVSRQWLLQHQGGDEH